MKMFFSLKEIAFEGIYTFGCKRKMEKINKKTYKMQELIYNPTVVK